MTGRRRYGPPRLRLAALAGLFLALSSCSDSTVEPPKVTEPPLISSVSLVPWATVAGTVTVNVTAENADSVSLLVDGDLKAVDRESPYALAWNTTHLANGLHLALARARNALGRADSLVITLVDNPGEGTGVAVRPLTAVLEAGQSQQFTAIVLDNVNTAVTWSLATPGGDIDDPGTIDTNGFYQAPDSVAQTASITVFAHSVPEPGTAGLATITLH